MRSFTVKETFVYFTQNADGSCTIDDKSKDFYHNAVSSGNLRMSSEANGHEWVETNDFNGNSLFFKINPIRNMPPLQHHLCKCINCEYHFPCHKHPWNEGEAEGSILEIFGYVCTESMEHIIFQDEPSVGCEMFGLKESAQKIYDKEIKDSKEMAGLTITEYAGEIMSKNDD